jgi:hypothetical protein
MEQSTGLVPLNSPVPAVLFDKRFYGLPQFDELSMKKMIRPRKNTEFRARFETVYPCDSVADSNEIVLIALDDQPWALRLHFRLLRHS